MSISGAGGDAFLRLENGQRDKCLEAELVLPSLSLGLAVYGFPPVQAWSRQEHYESDCLNAIVNLILPA